jgi:hypothetical protein
MCHWLGASQRDFYARSADLLLSPFASVFAQIRNKQRARTLTSSLPKGVPTMSAHRAVFALSFVYAFGLSNAAFAQQQSGSAAPTIVLANSLEVAARTEGTRPSTDVAAKVDANVRPAVVPPGTINDTQPVTDRTATGRPRRLGPDRAEQ